MIITIIIIINNNNNNDNNNNNNNNNKLAPSFKRRYVGEIIKGSCGLKGGSLSKTVPCLVWCP